MQFSTINIYYTFPTNHTLQPILLFACDFLLSKQRAYFKNYLAYQWGLQCASPIATPIQCSLKDSDVAICCPTLTLVMHILRNKDPHLHHLAFYQFHYPCHVKRWHLFKLDSFWPLDPLLKLLKVQSLSMCLCRSFAL